MNFAADNKKAGIYPPEILGKIYDLLVEHAGARNDPYDRNTFVECALNWDYRFNFEYRFQGKLGFGGKIWLPLDQEPYISCYSEDETPERKAMIKKTNAKLKALVQP